jgi:hypothetical protein
LRVRVAIAVTVLLAGGSAHAMGTAWDDTLLAWNRDGSAALIERTSFRDGDKGLSYTVVAAGKAPVTVAISSTTRDTGTDLEQLPDRDCVAAVKQLTAVLAADHFDGVVVHAGCTGVHAATVAVPARVAREAERSWVALAQGRPRTPRETVSWELANRVTPGYKPLADDAACGDTLDIANATGKLILVFASWRCNDPIRTSVHAFEPSTGGYVEQE